MKAILAWLLRVLRRDRKLGGPTPLGEEWGPLGPHNMEARGYSANWTYYWVGEGPSWSDAENWNPSGVPGEGVSVTINYGDTPLEIRPDGEGRNAAA